MYLPVVITHPDLTIELPDLTGNESVVSYRGYSVPLVEQGQVRFYQHGWVCNLALSNGSFYPLQERHGIICHDASQNAKHGILRASSGNTSLMRGLATTQASTDLHELNVGHNSYFVGQGKGFRLSNYPLPVAFTAAFLCAANGDEIELEFEGTANTASASISIGTEAKWLTLRKNNDVWVIFIEGTQVATTNEAVGEVAGDIDALIGSADLPIATRRFALWNRALRDAEIPRGNVSITDADVQWHASSSTKNPVKNLAGELYDGVGQPIISNAPANRDTGMDVYGQPCTIMNTLQRGTIPSIETPESYNDWREAVRMDIGQDAIKPTKFAVGMRTKIDGRVSKHEHVRVIEIVR